MQEKIEDESEYDRWYYQRKADEKYFELRGDPVPYWKKPVHMIIHF